MIVDSMEQDKGILLQEKSFGLISYVVYDMPKMVSAKFKEKHSNYIIITTIETSSLLASPSIAAGGACSVGCAQRPLELPLATSKVCRSFRALIRRGLVITEPISTAHGLVAGLIARFHIVRNSKVVAVAQVALRRARAFRPVCSGASPMRTAVVEEASEGYIIGVAVGDDAFLKCARIS